MGGGGGRSYTVVDGEGMGGGLGKGISNEGGGGGGNNVYNEGGGGGGGKLKVFGLGIGGRVGGGGKSPKDGNGGGGGKSKIDGKPLIDGGGGGGGGSPPIDGGGGGKFGNPLPPAFPNPCYNIFLALAKLSELPLISYLFTVGVFSAAFCVPPPIFC